ncbi:MAG: hypothetical protein ACNA77_08660 [Opitutales bacterium]
MKVRSLLFAFLLFYQFAAADGLELGDNFETTIEKLGQPVGTIQLSDRTMLLYPEGEVVLREDAVVKIDLISKEEYAAQQAQLKEDREQWLIQKARMEEARIEEGKSILAAKRGSSAFASLPAKDRVDYWRSFQIHYPEVDASAELAQALNSYQTQLAELQTQERIAELEARVAKAEQEAATARLETKRLQEETERTRWSTNYGLRYYQDPVVVRPRYIHRPSTVTIITKGEKKQVETRRSSDHWNLRNYNSDSTAERVTRILHGD